MSSLAGVLSVGMACPLGLRARPALAAIRAGVRRFGEIEEVLDLAGEPVRASHLRSLARGMTRPERAVFFAAHALADALEPTERGHRIRLPVYLILPSANSDPVAAALATGLPRMLSELLRQEQQAITLDFNSSRFFFQGRAACFGALRAAIHAMSHGEEHALLVAADSLADDATLRLWAKDNRLLGKRNGDGVIPGEGAAVLLLAAPRAQLRHRCLAFVQAVEYFAPASLSLPVISCGDGLAAVFRTLHQQSPNRVDEIVSAQPASIQWTRAFSYASLRNAALMPEPLRFLPFGAAVGDVGAAAGAMAMVHAVVDFQLRAHSQSVSPHSQKLVYAMSDSRDVGGTVLASLQDGPII